MIKGLIQEGDIMFVNIYVPNIGALKYIKQILTDIKGKIDNNTNIVGKFYTPLTSMNRSSRQKISKERVALNDTFEQLDLIGIYRTFHPIAQLSPNFLATGTVFVEDNFFHGWGGGGRWSGGNASNGSDASGR